MTIFLCIYRLLFQGDHRPRLISGGTLVKAPSFAVMTSVNAGITCLMKRLRGKMDAKAL